METAGIGPLIERMNGQLAELRTAGDRRAAFHATYTRTTEAVGAALADGFFLDTAWVEQWDIAFAKLYLDALDADRRGEPVPRRGGQRAGGRSFTDTVLQPLNRLATKRLLRESRRKVWANAIARAAARRAGGRDGDEHQRQLNRLEELSAARVADLMRPGPVLLRLAAGGFGVELS